MNDLTRRVIRIEKELDTLRQMFESLDSMVCELAKSTALLNKAMMQLQSADFPGQAATIASGFISKDTFRDNEVITVWETIDLPAKEGFDNSITDREVEELVYGTKSTDVPAVADDGQEADRPYVVGVRPGEEVAGDGPVHEVPKDDPSGISALSALQQEAVRAHSPHPKTGRPPRGPG